MLAAPGSYRSVDRAGAIKSTVLMSVLGRPSLLAIARANAFTIKLMQVAKATFSGSANIVFGKKIKTDPSTKVHADSVITFSERETCAVCGAEVFVALVLNPKREGFISMRRMNADPRSSGADFDASFY